MNDANKEMLDTSIPKDQFFFLVLSIVFGFLIGLSFGYFLFGKTTFQYELIIAAIAGSFLGTFGFSRKGSLPIVVSLIFSLIYVPSMPSLTILFLSSACVALALISSYHFAMHRKTIE